MYCVKGNWGRDHRRIVVMAFLKRVDVQLRAEQRPTVEPLTVAACIFAVVKTDKLSVDQTIPSGGRREWMDNAGTVIQVRQIDLLAPQVFGSSCKFSDRLARRPASSQCENQKPGNDWQPHCSASLMSGASTVAEGTPALRVVFGHGRHQLSIRCRTVQVSHVAEKPTRCANFG